MTGQIVKLRDCVLGERRSRRLAGPASLGALRLIEIESLLRHRGIERAHTGDFVVLVHHALNQHEEPGSPSARDAARIHLSVVARHLSSDTVASIVADAAHSRCRWTAQALGEALALTEDERRGLDLRTIRFVGQTRQQQREAKRARDRAGAAERRRAAGAVPRQTYVSESVAEEARRLGVSRQTVHRRRLRCLPDVTGSSRILPKGDKGGDAGVARNISKAAGFAEPARQMPSGPAAVVASHLAKIAETSSLLARHVAKPLLPSIEAARRLTIRVSP